MRAVTTAWRRRSLRRGTLIVGIATVALLGAAADDPPIPVERYQLANGLTMLLAPNHASQTVALNVVYRVGSRDEPPGRMGFAHLFEHLMFDGSAHAPDGLHQRLISAAGGFSNANTFQELTNYFETAASQHLERLLWLEADRMGYLESELDSATFERERSAVKNERRQNMIDPPLGRAFELSYAARYPEGHPSSWHAIGYMADLDAAKLEDARAFHRQWYMPSNAILTVVGDFERDSVRTWIQRYFGPLRSEPRPTRRSPPAVRMTETLRLTVEDRVSEPVIEMHWTTVPEDHPDHLVLDLIAAILSHSKASRIDVALKERLGLVRSVSAQQIPTGGSFFSIPMTPAEGHTLTELEVALDSVLELFAREGPTDDELRIARAVRELQLASTLESNIGRALRIGRDEFSSGNPLRYRDDLARLRSISRDEVRAVTRRYLRAPHLTLSFVPVGKPDLASHPATSRLVRPRSNGVGYQW